jgi:hypothetical protein
MMIPVSGKRKNQSCIAYKMSKKAAISPHRRANRADFEPARRLNLPRQQKASAVSILFIEIK